MEKNLAIIGLGGSGLASLYSMVGELKKTLGPDDHVTINVIDQFGDLPGGWTYRHRGGDEVTTATHIDCMGIGKDGNLDPKDLIKRMNANPGEWKKFVPYRDLLADGTFDPASTITYKGYQHYMELIRNEIGEGFCFQHEGVAQADHKVSDPRITINFIKGRAQSIEDDKLFSPGTTDINKRVATKAKKTISYLSEADPQNPKSGVPLPDIHGVMVCLGNGMPNPGKIIGARMGEPGKESNFYNRIDSLADDNVLKRKNVVLIGAGNAAVAACVLLHNKGYKGDITIVSRSDDIPLLNLERGQKPWERKFFNIKEIRALVETARDGGRILNRDKDGKRIEDKMASPAATRILADQVKALLRDEFESMIAEIKKTNPTFDHKKFIESGKLRHTPWSEEHDWRDILDSLDHDAKTGEFRQEWNEIMGALPGEVLIELEKDRDKLTRKYTGASWANSRHRTPVDHWKILEEMEHSQQLQTRHDFYTVQPGSAGPYEFWVHMKNWTPLEKMLNEKAQQFLDMLKAVNNGGPVQVKEIQRLAERMGAEKPYTCMKPDNTLTIEEVAHHITPAVPPLESLHIADGVIVNTTGHTTKLDEIDSVFARLMDMKGQICKDEGNGGIKVDKQSRPVRKDGSVDPYVRYVGTATGLLGPWNKTIMMDIIPNAAHAVHGLLHEAGLDKVKASPFLDADDGVLQAVRHTKTKVSPFLDAGDGMLHEIGLDKAKASPPVDAGNGSVRIMGEERHKLMRN